MVEVADTIDLAYVAIGVKQALVDYGVIDSSRFEGELGFIQACIDRIEYLDQAWEPQKGVVPVRVVLRGSRAVPKYLRHPSAAGW